VAGDDPGARFLAEMLREAGIPADHVVVGAAVMCRPASRRLESAVGMPVCLQECAAHVRELLRLTSPDLVVPLGKAALRSLRWALPERPELARLRFPESVGRTVHAGALRVHPLYHVTARARLRRPEARQREDWRALGRAWREILSAEKAPSPG
jgi:uracil-DNA glycosylase family 4